MEGYIQLHRQLLDSYQFSNPNMLKMWIWMLLKANYKKSVISLKVGKKYTDVVVDRGQFIFGRTKAASELEMDESAIYRMVKKLEIQNAITVKSNNQYSIVTICKYDTYNKKEKSDEQPLNSERTATEQPLNTYNKDNKVNKDNNILIINEDSKKSSLYKSLVSYWLDEFHIGWTFGAQHGKTLKSIITKIKTVQKNAHKESTDESVFESFKLICENLPEWYKDKDLPILNSKFNEIMTEIKNRKNGKSITTKQHSSEAYRFDY